MRIGCFPFDDASRYKYRSVFVTYWIRKIERHLYQLVSLNGKHLYKMFQNSWDVRVQVERTKLNRKILYYLQFLQ